MPRTLKRRADAISRNEPSDSDSDPAPQPSTQRQQRRQRRRSTPPGDGSPSDGTVSGRDETNEPQTYSQTTIKKLVRLALSAEYARQPLRRTDITAKVLKGDSATSSSTRPNFRTVFLGAQKTLQEVFGMELVDLPVRERTGLNERRKAASQKATQREKESTQWNKQTGGEDETQGRSRAKDPLLSAQSWILVSTLPEGYKTRPELLIPGRASDEATDSAYTALYTLIVSLLYLHTPSTASSEPNANSPQGFEDLTEPLSDSKLQRFLRRVNISDFVPLGTDRAGMTTEKLLARMMREGYIERRRDMSSGEEQVEWVVGPRGKREVGRRGVAGLVRGVYGFGVDGRGKGLEAPAPDAVDADDNGAEDEGRQRRVKMEKDELERRLKRTLGDVVALHIHDGADGRGDMNEQEAQEERNGGRGGEKASRSSGRHRRDEDE